mgnify:FL=1
MRLAKQQELPGVELLRLARGSIEHGLIHSEPLPVRPDSLPPAFAETRATFTTLRRNGELRGCCGTLEASRPICADVAHSAFQAAFRDPRFGPVVHGELEDIRLEVAVLSPLEPVAVASEADLLGQLQPGTDGLVILAGGRRATFLPKVWESLPDPGEFLAALRVKCGLQGDYWSEELQFERYRTVSYAEPA